MPVRTVRSHGRNVIGFFPSRKMGGMIQFESTIERDCLFFLDYDADVVSFEEQPFAIAYTKGRKQLQYTPDFRVMLADEMTVIVECKASRFVDTAENQQKFKVGRAYCDQHGWQYVVITDDTLRQNGFIDNVRLLTQHARHTIDVITQSAVFTALASTTRPLTMADVMTKLNPDHPQQLVTPLLNMAFHHHVYIPLDRGKITAQSPIYLENPHGKTTIFNGM